MAGVPALILTIGSIFVPDTPNSLIQRGKNEQAREVSLGIFLCMYALCNPSRFPLFDILLASVEAKEVRSGLHCTFSSALNTYKPLVLTESCWPTGSEEDSWC
jgi:hypothetical protein